MSRIDTEKRLTLLEKDNEQLKAQIMDLTKTLNTLHNAQNNGPESGSLVIRNEGISNC